MECQVSRDLILEYIVDKDAANGSADQYIREKNLVVLQERIVTPPERLGTVTPLSRDPLVIFNDSSLPVQRSMIAVNGSCRLEQLDFGVMLESDDTKMLFSHPLSTGETISFDSFNKVYTGLSRLLDQADLKANRIVRKWFFAKDIFRDYELINQVRDGWFSTWFNGSDFIPASTGIQSLINRSGHISLEFLAIDGKDIQIDQMHCSMQNEPIEYNKMFSRGILVSAPRGRIAFISGTASTDERGEVKYVADIARQFEHTLDCIADLLESVGMGFADIAQGMMWLKRKGDYQPCLEIARRYGFPIDRCLSLLDCNVCRDDWLCEIEVTAYKNKE